MTADADNAGRGPTAAPTHADDYPETAAGTSHGAGDAETELVPPATTVAPGQAWSEEETATEVPPRPWRSVWVVAGVGVLGAVVAAVVIAAVGVGSQPGGPGERGRLPTSQAAMPASTPAAAPPPPSTVTVTQAPPSTVTVEAAPPPPPSSGTDVFTICPDGHEGVVGGHTTCAFAENVRRMFYATGMSNSFTAFSPVTGEGYEMTCVGRYPAYFEDGSTKISTRCYGGSNAEVVIW